MINPLLGASDVIEDPALNLLSCCDGDEALHHHLHHTQLSLLHSRPPGDECRDWRPWRRRRIVCWATSKRTNTWRDRQTLVNESDNELQLHQLHLRKTHPNKTMKVTAAATILRTDMSCSLSAGAETEIKFKSSLNRNKCSWLYEWLPLCFIINNIKQI